VLKKAENKLNVRALATKFGIQTVPTSKEAVKDVNAAKKIAKKLVTQLL